MVQALVYEYGCSSFRLRGAQFTDVLNIFQIVLHIELFVRPTIMNLQTLLLFGWVIFASWHLLFAALLIALHILRKCITILAASINPTVS